MDAVSILTFVVAVVAVAATGYAYFRSSAVKVWEQNTEAYKARVEVLEAQNTGLLVKISLLESRITELEARPDWAAVVQVVGTSEANIIEAIRQMLHQVVSGHEARTARIAADLAAKLADKR